MKNIIALFMLILALITASCSKLEEDPKGLVTPELFFQNATEINQFIYGSYLPLNRYEFYGMSWFSSSEAINDQVISDTLTSAENRAWYTFSTPGDGNPHLWKWIFSGINSANILINGVNACPVLNDDTKKPYIAEARFLRGLYYFHGLLYWGKIPLILEDTPYQTAVTMGRVDTTLIWDQIISDMTYAAENGVEDFGKIKSRGTKWSARAFLSRMYLYRKQFSKAAEAAKMVMESGKYSLLANFADLWLEANEQSDEVVFSTEYLKNVYTSSYGSFFTPSPGNETSTTPGVQYNGWGGQFAVGSAFAGNV